MWVLSRWRDALIEGIEFGVVMVAASAIIVAGCLAIAGTVYLAGRVLGAW